MVVIDRSQVLNSAKWSNQGMNHKTVLVIHETANTSHGANAYAHHRLQYNGNPRQASWHWQVDDKVAVQTYSEDLRLWHAGRVAIPFTIAVEICVNSDSNYNQAIKNAVELAVDICTRNNININDVVTHNYYTGKICPYYMLNGRGGWTFTKFRNEVAKGLSGDKPKPIKQPNLNNKTIEQLAKEVINGAYGNGAERMKRLGSKYEQVQNLVNDMLLGESKPSIKPESQILEQLATEVIAGVHGNGEERKRKLGKRYNSVQKIVNKRLGSNYEPDITELVDRTIRGEFGNGDERKRKLGKRYDEVQKRINQIYFNR